MIYNFIIVSLNLMLYNRGNFPPFAGYYITYEETDFRQISGAVSFFVRVSIWDLKPGH
jgi:hypothetical protein